MSRLSRRELLVAGGTAVVAAGVAFPRIRTTGMAAGRDETVVAGSDADFMIVRHLRLEGTQRQIGQALAELAKSRHGTRLETIEPKLLAARKAWFAEHYRAMAERADGVTDAYRVADSDMQTDPFGLGYDLLDQPGCSTVYYPGSMIATGHATLSRNYDFSTRTLAEIVGKTPKEHDRAFTADPYVLELRPKSGIASLALVSYDLLCGCIDGVNEKGLSVALLADDVSPRSAPSPTVQPGLGEIEVPRFLLDTCSSVEDVKAAVKDLQRYYTFVPCHYIVGDAQGHSCIVEWTVPDGTLKVTDGGGSCQIVTNHLVSEYTDRAKFPHDPWPVGSFARYCKLQDKIAETKGKLTTDRIKAINQAVQAGPLQGPPQAADDPKPGRTLWHSVYDLSARSLEVSFYLGEARDGRHGQRRTPYLTFAL